MAASSNAIRAGRAFVELFADDKPLVRGLKAAQAKLNAFGQTIAKIGAGMTAAGLSIVTPMLAAAKTFSDVGSNLVDMSGRTGIAVEQLSALKYAAEQSGTSMETLEKGIRKMQATVTDAADGGKSSAEAFEQLGLSVKDLQGLAPDKQFLVIADALAGVVDPTERAARAMAIFGRSGAELLPLISQGSAGISALTKEAERLGLVMSTEDAVAAELFGDILGKVQAQIARAVVALGTALGPILSTVGELFSGGAASVQEWVEENGNVIRIAAGIGAGLAAAGVAVTALGAAFTALGTVVGIAATGVVAIGAVLSAIVSPIGLITTAIVGGVGAWLVYSQAGQAAMAEIGKRFGDFKADAATAFKGIADALAAGDLKLAGTVAMAGLELAWKAGTTNLQEMWARVTDKIKEIYIDFSTELQKIWIELFTELSRAFPGLVKGAAHMGSAIKGIVANALGEIGIKLGLVDEKDGRRTLAIMAEDRAKELQAELDKINQAHDDPEGFRKRELAELEKLRNEAQEARDKATKRDIDSAQLALDNARAALRAAQEQATLARNNAGNGKSTDPTKKITVDLPDMEEIAQKLEGAADVMAAAQDQMPQAMALGSQAFAEQMLRSLAPGQVTDQIEREQLAQMEENNRIVAELLKEMKAAPTVRRSSLR